MNKFNINQKKCIGCGACTSVCPANAISMKNGVAIINEKKCIGCGACASVCPADAINNK
jgi:pyruvate formate lyase activating enzyme